MGAKVKTNELNKESNNAMLKMVKEQIVQTDSLEKNLLLGKIEVRRRGWQMVEWHHEFNEHELGQTLGDGEGQGCLACYSPQGHKEWDIT